MKSKNIQCPHGNNLYSEVVQNGVRHIHAGLPECCYQMQCAPASGVLNRRGKQKQIFNGVRGNILVEASSI